MNEYPIIRDGRTPNPALYAVLLDAVENVEGVFVEFGVYRGETFQVIYEKALSQDRRVYAFDSFCGMAEPTMPGDDLYPAGMFDAGGTTEFKKKFPRAFVHEGFVPDILKIIGSLPYAFVHIDLDHKSPTRPAIEWSWELMSEGSIMACHDFRHGQTVRASAAISEWMSDTGNQYVGLCDLTIWFRKGAS